MPPDLGYYKQIKSESVDHCMNECNKDAKMCLMFTFYHKVIVGSTFCRFYKNSVEVDSTFKEATTFKRANSIG